ncbi:protein NRT1/ PTR FAMILY 3.1-like [Asparagus officinalis]|uniref:protein NRT1/ PTR FAMILY 3.1-like n=3 Tax=Asparagus officinalis TaxID=4686 RepID=UPI00098E0E36|nr:protein NRT1/ PTR FAMILY 3.1-like [Asparagus officinalis]
MESKNGGGKKKAKRGGFKTMPFILGNDICDKFATAGFNANMVSYLTSQLHLPLVTASNTLSNLSGTSSLTTIIGALIADSFAGRFWTITVGSLIYQLGMITLTISAILPALRPPPCTPPDVCHRPSTFQLLVLYSSLILTCIGAGGIRPCVVTFGADQFELDKTRTSTRKWNYFSLYYFALSVSHLLALTLVVYIQDNVGWGWGFGIPSMVMFVSVVVFVIGYPLYIKIKPAGSPMTRLTQVLIAAFKKRKIAKPEDPSLLFVDKELDADISTGGSLIHTEQLRFLDQAAIITDGDMTDSGKTRLWRLSTVHRVEELKSVIRLIPIWSVGILTVTAASHNHSFAIIQAKAMNRHLTPNGFQVPAASMSIFATVMMIIALPLYDKVIVPISRRFKQSGFTYLHRIGIGLAIQVLAIVLAALVEHKRKLTVTAPISVFWLVPQYAVHGLAESFIQVGHMEFLYDQSPESMRSTAVALFNLAASIGHYMGTALVTAVSKYTKKRGDWLQDDINRGKLDSYYWLVTVLQVINLGYYLVCAKLYTYKTLEVDGVEKGGGSVGDLELVNSVED